MNSLRPPGMDFRSKDYEKASKIKKIGIDMNDLEEYKEYYFTNTVKDSIISSEIHKEVNDVIKKYSDTDSSIIDENDKLKIKANENNCFFFKKLKNTHLNLNRYHDHSSAEITYPNSIVFRLNKKDKKIYKRLDCSNSLHLINVMVEFVYMKLAHEFYKKNNNSMTVPKPDIEFIKIIDNDEVSKCHVFLVSDDVVDEGFKSFEIKQSDRSISNELNLKDVTKEEIYKAMYKNLIDLNNYGIYHNDVNPGNVFIKINDVKPKYEFKLIDFGNACTKPDHNNQRNSLKRHDVIGDNITKMTPEDFDLWRTGYTSDRNYRYRLLRSFGGKRLSKKVNLKKYKKIKTKKRKRTNKKRKKNMRV